MIVPTKPRQFVQLMRTADDQVPSPGEKIEFVPGANKIEFFRRRSHNIVEDPLLIIHFP